MALNHGESYMKDSIFTEIVIFSTINFNELTLHKTVTTLRLVDGATERLISI